MGAAALGQMVVKPAAAKVAHHVSTAHHVTATPAAVHHTSAVTTHQSTVTGAHHSAVHRLPHHGSGRMVHEASAGHVQIFRGRGYATAAVGERRIHILNGHTHERIEAVYWRDGAYLPDTMHQVSRVLRDHMSGEMHAMDPRLMDLLADLHSTVGTYQPFTVISGYRSPRTNAWMRRTQRGVAQNSLHMKGKAADVLLAGENLSTLHNAALSLSEGGVGYYPRTGFVHVDTGQVRQWVFA